MLDNKSKKNYSASEQQIEKAVKDSKNKKRENVKNKKSEKNNKFSNKDKNEKEDVHKVEQKGNKKVDRQIKENKKKPNFEELFYRAEAELQNMDRRFEKEKANLLKYEGQNLAKSIFPVLDNLERALSVNNENPDKLKNGVKLTYKTLINALKENGISTIGKTGVEFDPNFHDAIQRAPISDPAKQKDNTVAVVLQKGYELHGRILRPAMVSVYKK